MNIPKEGINIGVKANEVPMDGVTNASVDKKGNIIIYPGDVKVPENLRYQVRPGEVPKITGMPPAVSEVARTLEQLKTEVSKITTKPTFIQKLKESNSI